MKETLNLTAIVLLLMTIGGCNGCKDIAPQKVLLNLPGVVKTFAPKSIAISGNKAMAAIECCSGGVCFRRVQCMEFDGTDWKLTQTIEPMYDSTACDFGNDLAIDGNYAVIAHRVACNGNLPRAHVYEYSNNKWNFRQTLWPLDTAEINPIRYANSVDIKGDYIIVTNPDDSASKSCAYIFKRRIDNWVHVARLTPEVPEAFDQFGMEAVMGDGVCMVSSFYNNEDPLKNGSVHIFAGENNAWQETQILSPENVNVEYRFGNTLDYVESYLVVGSPRPGYPQLADRAYIFKQTQDTFEPDTFFQRDLLFFGSDMATSGTDAFVHDYGIGTTDRYKRTGTDWNLLQTFQPLNNFEYHQIETNGEYLMWGGVYNKDTSAVFFQKIF